METSQDSSGPPLSAPTNRASVRTAYLLAVIAVGTALSIYQPWRFDPFPLRDFGRLLGLLAPTNGIGDSFSALADYFRIEGRLQPLFMASLAAQWKVFGLNIVAWQFLRFALMLGLAGLTVLIARRCGASQPAAVAGAGCALIVASGAHESWFLLQVAEPMGALFLLFAIVVAMRWRRRAWLSTIIIAILVVAAVLSKETMLAGLPFTFAVMLCRADESWRYPTFDRRAIVSIGVISAAVTLCAIMPILSVRAATPTDAYAAGFGLSSISWSRLSNSLRAIFLPVTRVLWFPANALFLGVIVAGWYRWAKLDRKAATIAGSVLLTLPLCGALLYAAWPFFPGYYALPFLPAVALGLALALTAVATARRAAIRISSYAATACIFFYGLILSWNGAVSDRAIRRLDYGAVLMASGTTEAVEMVVGASDPSHSGGMGTSIALYARAIGRLTPPAGSDVSCEEAADLVRARPRSRAVIFLSTFCEQPFASAAPPAMTHGTSYQQVDWKTLHLSPHRLSAVLWPPDRAGLGVYQSLAP